VIGLRILSDKSSEMFPVDSDKRTAGKSIPFQVKFL